ncbi:dihydroorotase [Flavobacterium frigoris]|uniref:Dihydroorotase n=1 Tax=Flavobacterium frigoris (strain PS1) TaxID=1086011 RepID=H7FUJ0_FLAFP|nr:dihydroorotase [Flavobacterium frigoris]EIA07937.1 dihydroorotase [Flavobacterium frigoris PS1]
MRTIIRSAFIVNEGKIITADLLMVNERIEKIEAGIDLTNSGSYHEINAEGLYLLPGIIDDQVHFREPGLTHKGTIYSESKAAVAGGITSFMDMPNTIPNTLTQELLEEKYAIAAKKSLANYSFFMGINQNNLEEALKTDNENVCGITDDGLYFNNDEGILTNYPEFLEKLFSSANTLVALHSEDDAIMKRNTFKYRKRYGEQVLFKIHPKIRSEEACLVATKRVLEIAKKYNNRLHLFHVSTAAEANLFEGNIPIREKRITAEACIHHLWFSDKDYEKLGAKIKWNPAIKTEKDKNGLLAALLENKLDIIATDHAPHTNEEKSRNYFQALSGGPLVQHALSAMLELFHKGKISLEKIVEKMCHNVAEIYRMKERGYIREGNYADLVLIDINTKWTVTNENTHYKCQWSPFENQIFNSKIVKTFVNGTLVYDQGSFNKSSNGKRLKFEKHR